MPELDLLAARRRPSAISRRRLAGRIGAELGGLRLSGDIHDVDVAAIEAALLAHKVVFIRDQHHLSDTEQERFSARLGPIAVHPTAATLEGTQAVLELDSRTAHGRSDMWHTDMTFTVDYPRYSVLRAVISPEFGGDTVWSNTAAAYDELPGDLRSLADGLRAVHTNAYDYATEHPGATAEQQRYHADVFASVLLRAEHPVVRVHPQTAERSVLLGGFVERLAGHSRRESDRIVELLQSYVQRIENTVRWSWRVGDVAIWDNRATQHYAIYDYGEQPRVMRRTTVQGDRPIGPDGRPSVPLA